MNRSAFNGFYVGFLLSNLVLVTMLAIDITRVGLIKSIWTFLTVLTVVFIISNLTSSAGD